MIAEGQTLTSIYHNTAKPRRPAPFSVRLSKEERARLEAEAQGVPLGTYIKAKALGGAPLKRAASVDDRKALAQALALLGKTHYANNLNQLAHLASMRDLPPSACSLWFMRSRRSPASFLHWCAGLHGISR